MSQNAHIFSLSSFFRGSFMSHLLVTSWSAFWYSNQDTKIKTLVRPVLLYGCETWKITKKDERKLNSFQYQCLRRILRIRWQQRMTNKRVVETAEINEISREVRRRRRKGYDKYSGERMWTTVLRYWGGHQRAEGWEGDQRPLGEGLSKEREVR